jgi:hypothetical protein
MAGCVPWELDSACCEGWDDLDPSLQERATDLAWSTIRVLSGGRVGACPVTVRPCLTAPCSVCAPHGQWARPFIRDGEWHNAICGRDPCSCARLCEINVGGDVAAIISVLLDGDEMPLDSFRVDNGHLIVRMDGECWPSCQDLTLPLGEPGTLGITYVPGIVPDGSALWMAGVLACEFTKACQGQKCRLPSAVTAIARQGVTMSFQAEMFEGGMTGIREVDAWLVSVNPFHLVVPPMVWSPDVPWAKHRYTTPTVPVVP